MFKRDSFKCQYCGESAPEVILHVDHIHPVSKGGCNDIANLLTSCKDCNLGKGATKLSDATAIKKQKEQLDSLNEKREQLKMMLDWREGLQDIGNQSINAICDLWTTLLNGSEINANGKSKLKKLLKFHSLNEILDAVEKAVDQYVSMDETDEETNNAFNKIGAILNSKNRPDYMKHLFYIRGIARNRFDYCNDKLAIILLKDAYLSVDDSVKDDALVELKNISLTVKNWTEFKISLEGFVEDNSVNYEDENG